MADISSDDPPSQAASNNTLDESQLIGTHSRIPFSVSASDSPPMTPRSPIFNIPYNPFSPPASIHSLGTESMTSTPAPNAMNEYPFHSPQSGMTSRAVSSSDLPSRVSSRPGTGDAHTSQRPSISKLGRESFASPPSRPLTIYSAPAPASKIKRERPKSTMLLTRDDVHKPWIKTRDSSGRLAYFITYGVAFLGIAASAINAYFDWQGTMLMTGNLCSVLDEDFTNGEDGLFGDNGIFFREVDMSGFGNGEFEMTTASENNSFVSNGNLYILPTLTSDSVPMAEILDGSVYNISGCTFNITDGQSYTQSTTSTQPILNTTAIGQDSFDAAAYYKACSAVSNATTGQIINPVQSARLSTRKSASIKYGKVEVRAKIPTGDWMWPAIWMLPVDNTYGSWPLSGEIDIMEARGNGPDYSKQGTNYIRGSLNWGPLSFLNAVAKTYGWWYMRRGSYDQNFHTYAMEWTEEFIRLYVDSRLHHTLQLKMNEPFFERGDFPTTVQNGSDIIPLANPWINGTNAAPFDQKFYLILDVGVGGTNGWFPDGSGGKPWLDGSQTAMRDFLLAQDQWYPTWPTNTDQRAFVIDHVKMWQQC